MQKQYNFKGIFKSRDNDSKPSFLRDVVRLHTHNSMESNKAFILDREDQFEGFFSRNFQDQIEQRSIELLYDNRERLTREAVFEHANYSFTSRLLNNANGVMGRMFASFETPNLFDSDTESEKFGRETLHEFLNILKESNVDEARNNRIKESVAPKPIAEMNYKFDNYINNNIANAENASRHINKDIRDFKHRVTAQGSVIDYFTNKGYSRSIKLMDNIDYINRPGILPAVGMIHDAESELSINIFQLQNKPIIDYLTADLVSRAEEIRKQREAGATVKNFTFRLQLAWNEELANDAASYNILGPNLTAIRTFQNLAAKYADALDITVQTLDRRNHTKLIFSDQGAYISTQNQTAPVGKSLYQAGSNYESGRYVRNLQITPNSTVSERSEAKLYQQVKELQTTMFRQKLLQTNQPNISGPVETYEMMKSSLDYLQKNKGTGVKIDFILDQVFLLQYDSMLFDKVAEGEMGPESKGTLKRVITDLDNKKNRYRTDIQEPLMLALIEGKAHVTTDVRNFKQKVQEPIYTELMKLDSFKDSGYNLETFLNDDISLSTEQRINRVTAKVGSRDRAIQLLAIASGNIQTANVPRQHVKASLLYRTSANGIEGIAGELSSSNRGLYSMSLIDNDFERDMTNNELGMMFYSEDFARELNINKESAYSLEGNEVTEELQEYTKHYISMKSDLSTRRVGQLEYSNVNNRAEWEKDVDRKKLVNLFNSLTEMNKSTGGDAMKISYDYNNKGPISILVDLNNGLKYRFTALQGGVNNQGFIYEINKSKVIGESDFINQSSESIRTSFTDNGNPIFIGSKERLTLTPIQTTMSMISSISLEASQIRLIRAPLIEYQTHYAPGAEGSDNFDAGIARYLLALSGYSDRGVTDVLNIDQGSIIKGALENLHLRMKNSDATLDKVRQFAGIDINSEDRQAKLQYLTDLIQVFGNVNENDRRLLITGEGLEGRQSLKRFMSFLFSSPEYADVLYDFIQSQGDPLYQQATNKYVKEVSSRVFDPYLNRTQVSVYGSTQAFRQRPLYGINERRAAFGRGVNNAALSNLQGMFRLGGYALAASPFDHDATADFGTDFKDGSLLFIQITGTGGSREKSGLEYSGYNEYDNLLPYYQHKKIGTATGLEIIQDAGVGSIIDKQSVADYNDAIAHLNLTVDSENLLQGNDRMLLFNFDVKKKASQIPQRIKNVIGSRPTMELTTNLQELIELDNTKFEGQNINNIEALRAAYLEDLRSKVAKNIGRKKADSLITDMYAVGIEFGGQIRATLSNDVAEVLESIRKDINTEFEGVDEDTKTEILRVRLLNADLSAHSVRGFIGSSKREGRNSFVLFQLSGAYSDYSFLNPEFGSTDTLDGMRTGFADRAVKGHQASKLSSQRLLGKKGDFNLADELLIQSGSYIKRDKDTGLFHVFSFDETEQKYVRGQAVSSRKEFTIVRNLLEAVKAEPSIGKLGTVSNAASFEGEMAIEILRDVRILEGEVTSNEIRTEIDYIRTGRRGGSARQESLSGGLAKMVPIFLYDPADENGTPQKGLLRQMFEQFEDTSGKVGSFGGASGLSYSQFYGVVNPSNLKSYFYEHGAQILIDNKKKAALLGTDGKTLAAALVMSFGTSRFASGDRTGVLDELAKFAASGDLGHFYQDQYLLGFLQHRGDTTKVAEGFVKSMEGISNLQVRALEYIGLDLIKDALTGNTNAASEIQKRVTDLLTDTTGVVGREYLNTGKDRGREMAIIAASLDYFVQLTQAKANDIAVVNTTRDRSAYLSLGTIGGMSYEELVEKENKGLSQLVNQLGRTSYTVGMWMSLSGSQSKVAISSKLESFIETQHTIFEPFYTNLTKFQKGGSLDSLRQLMAGFYGAMAGTHTGEFINAMSGLQQINLLDTRNPIFASRMVGYLNDPFTSDAEFKEYQRNYEMFGVLQSLVSNESGEISSIADKIRRVVEVYRKDAKNLDLNPDTLNTELNNLINAAEDNDLGRVQEIISQGYEYSLYHFERMYADFRLNPNKGDANAGQAISTGVQRSAGATGRFAFTLPVMEFNEGTIRVDKRSLQRSFSLAGEDLKIIGESFGNVDAPILKSQAILWQAFSPNSAVSRLLDRINDGQPISEVDVSLEDYEEIMRFYTTAINMPVEITEAIGVYGNKILGNKIGFAGGTTTPAAWFMGGTQMSILPEIIMERHGAGTNNRRKAHDEVLQQIKSLNIQIKEAKESLSIDALYAEKSEYSTKTKELQQKINEINAALIQETKSKQYLTYLARTLNKGISAAATSELNLLIEKSREFQERLQLASNNESELTKLIEDIEGTKESKYSITYYERNLQVSINEKGKERFGVNLNEGGDPFVDLLGLYELRTIRAAAISQGGTSNRLSNEAQEDSVQFAEDMKKLYSPFTGLVIGSEVDDYTNLPKVTPEEMALEMRRGASKLEKALGLNFDSISNLEKTTGKIYFERVISNIENFANERIAELQNRYDSKVNGELAEGTINRLRNMIRDVRAYENRLSDDMSKHDVRDIALLLTGEVEKYHAEINLGITQSMRPAPMGGSYMGRAVYDTFGLGDVNRLMRSWELPISFTPGGQEDVDHRNKTLHLFNPYSWLVSHLGDFDGDMITNMFRTTSQLDLRVRTYDASIAAAQEELILLGNKIQVTIPDTEEYTKLNKLKSDTEDRIGNLEKQKAEFSRLSQQAKDNTTYREYQIAAAKWVGNYLKVDYRMFLDDKHGGYRSENQGNVPPEVLFTYTEQGRGLFGGMEAIVTKSMDLFYDFRQLAENKLTLDTWGDVHNRLDNLSDSGLKELIQNGNLPNELKEEIIRLSSNYEDDPLVRDAQIAEYVARLYSSQSGLESLQKYNLKGIDGSAMTPDIFMAMENTLGQAGSVVLGKSYNTMVGMLYTESPNLALSYALLNDPDDKLKTIVVEAYTSQGMNGAAKYNEMKEAAQHSFLKSQQMGEFLQATQQILRDSIKPKDAALFIKELEEALLKYRGESDVEKKQEAYTEIVNKFGPGKGLKALIQMESLVQDLTILNRQIKDDNKDLQLQKTLEKYELTDTKKEELLKRLGYDETTGEYDVFRERDAQGNVIGKGFNRQIAAAQLSKEYIVAAYKTKQDMVSVVSDFAYTKGLNEGESTGRSMLSSFKENFNKFDATEQARITKLVQAADSYFTGGADLVGLQDAESQAFVEALMDRGNLSPANKTNNYKDTKWNKTSRINNQLEEQEYKQSEDYYKKLYEAHVYATTSDAFGKTVGDNGEMFIRFAQFNQARRDVYSDNHWRDTATGFDILSDPLAMAEMLGMVSGKITPEFIGKAMRVVTNAVRHQTGEANPSLETITSIFLQGTSMSETPEDKKMKEMFAFVQSKDTSATELLMQTVQSMALGQMSATAKEFIQRGQFDNQENLTQAVLKEHFSKMGFNEDVSYLLASRATMRITQGAVAQVEAKKMMDRNQMVNVIGSLGKDADVKAQSFIFPALGLIGAALASGDLSPEAFQVAAGTALTNLSYVRWNNLQDNFKRTAMNMIGGGAFKMRLALQENEGDAGKAIVTMATRELIMGSTAAIVNKYGTEYINKALGGIKTLDFDRFESARNVATSTMTAVASTLLGMMLGNGVLAAGKIINNEINESEQTVRKINQSIQQKVFNQAAVEEEEELAVEGDGEFLEYKTVHNWGEESDVDYTTDEWSINEEFNYAFNNTPVGMYSFEIT